MIQVCHSSISMLHKQPIHIDPVPELPLSAEACHNALDRALDTS